MGDKFIYTDNAESKIALENMGFRLIKECKDSPTPMWIFINDNTLKFSNIKDIVLSDKLTF